MADYLLSYDIVSLGDLYPQLHSFVKQHKLITQWSQPYQGLYLLKSDADLLTIVASFDEFLANRVLHVISPVDAKRVGGILPKNIWDWLQTSNTLGLLALLQQEKQKT